MVLQEAAVAVAKPFPGRSSMPAFSAPRAAVDTRVYVAASRARTKNGRGVVMERPRGKDLEQFMDGIVAGVNDGERATTRSW